MSTLDDFAQNVDMRVALREPFEPHQIKRFPRQPYTRITSVTLSSPTG